MSPLRPFRILVRKLSRDERGSVALIFAGTLIPVLLAIGLAVDTARAYAVKSQLQQALDAAALAVGSSSGTDAEMQALAQKFFDTNFKTNGLATSSSIQVSVVGDTITATGSATVDATLMQIGGFNTIAISEESHVVRAIRGLELAMVLDNTGSMTTSDNIGALRDAAHELTDILFGGQAVHPTLKIALVPYSASVNPGAVAQGLVSGSTLVEPTNVLGWKGCVVERAGANAVADTPASTAQWSIYKWVPAVDNTYTATKASTVRADPSYGNGSTGPNLGCPTAITPLTNEKSVIDTAITAMRAWSRGGTFSDIGMAWGLRVLSPEPPFTEGLPWGTEKWDKAVILMTDGDNQFYKLPSTASPNTVNNAVNSDYTGYGRLDELGRMGTTNITTAKTTINTRMASVCDAMKAKGITVYTITFTSSINSTTRDLYRNCASSPAKYFDSPTQDELHASFRAIATELSQLRLSL
jgi:Flp pilus assembly protein TadG